MNRLEATQGLVKFLTDELVVAGLSFGARDLVAAKDRPQHIYMDGGMSLGSPIGLGMALAVPSRKVIVLDGDGSLLMGLGVLTTVAMQAPRNLIQIVWDNGQWANTGGQAIATAFVTSLAEMAKGAGIMKSYEVSDLNDFLELVARALKEDGPWFICAKIIESGPTSVTIPRVDANVIRFLEEALS